MTCYVNIIDHLLLLRTTVIIITKHLYHACCKQTTLCPRKMPPPLSIMAPLDMEVGLDKGQVVLDGDPAPPSSPPKKGA